MTDARPVLHPTPEKGWLNDANGLTQWKGRHHVFHQFDSESLWFGRMTWGHFSSDDLVSWDRHPVALAPGDGPDFDGVWSGCVIDDDGVATAVYTGVVSREDGSKVQSICLARALDDGLIEWEKDAANPMQVEDPPFPVDAFRDPFVWRDGDEWAMLLGTGLPDGGGGTFLYRSADLRSWRYQGIFASGADLPPGSPWAGSVWECPNLAVYPNGDAVLLISVHDPATLSLHYTVALIGRIQDDRLVVSSARRLDHGHDCYAVAIEKTDDGRYLGYGWAWDAVSEDDRNELAWTGCLTVPREIGVRNGELSVAPAAELAARSSVVASLADVRVTGAESLELSVPEVSRIDLTLVLDHTSAVRVSLRMSPTTGEELVVDYNASRGTVIVDRSRASTKPGVRGGSSEARFLLPADGRVALTVILDETIVEIFVGTSVAFTERIYPQAKDATGLRIESRTEHFGERPAEFIVQKLEVARVGSP